MSTVVEDRIELARQAGLVLALWRLSEDLGPDCWQWTLTGDNFWRCSPARWDATDEGRTACEADGRRALAEFAKERE